MDQEEMNQLMEERFELEAGEGFWVTVELLGHIQTAGLLHDSDIPGLIRVDVPDSGTEYYGPAAIFRIKVVSEAIARGFVQPDHLIEAYNTPMILIKEHLENVARLNEDHANSVDYYIDLINGLKAEARELKVHALRLRNQSHAVSDDDEPEDIPF